MHSIGNSGFILWVNTKIISFIQNTSNAVENIWRSDNLLMALILCNKSQRERGKLKCREENYEMTLRTRNCQQIGHRIQQNTTCPTFERKYYFY